MEVKASLKNYRSTPRKTRLIADFVRGKNAGFAVAELKFINKKAGEGIIKLIDSAIANAQNNFGLEKENLFISSIMVSEGKSLKRHRAGSMGRALPIKRRLSHVNLTLTEKKAVKENK